MAGADVEVRLASVLGSVVHCLRCMVKADAEVMLALVLGCVVHGLG